MKKVEEKVENQVEEVNNSEDCGPCDKAKEVGKELDVSNKYIKEEQLETIKKQQNELTRHLRDIGFIETQKHSLLHKYAGIVEEVEEFKAGLEKEYGPINIDIESGKYTVIEENKE